MTQQSNVLVVEDRLDWQEILCESLSREGYRPFPAASYEEANAALASIRFELALIDPVLDIANRFNRDGLSVIQKIRDLQPAIPIVVITGSLTRDLKASLQQLCPGVPVLSKESWNPAEFGNLMHKLMGEHQARQRLQPAEPDQETAEPAPALIPPPLHTALGRPRVLVVENRPDWQNIVAGVLDQAGAFWRVASNAQEALLQLERESFHLIFLDLKLQQSELPLASSEGWLLLDYLVEARPKTRVVILSGKAGPSDVAHLLTHYPVIGFIEKQRFTPQAIVDAIAQAIQAPELRIQTLGQFRLWRDGQLIETWERPQAETVVKLLLVRQARGSRAVSADELITRLWPDADEESGRKKLLPLISNARHTLEPDIEPRDSNFILRSSTGYFFDLSGRVTWDLLEFRRRLQAGRQLVRAERWTEALAELEPAGALYQGDFLVEDRYADWVIDVRHEITTEYCHLLTLLADTYAALKRYPEAINACDKVLSKDPLLESIYRRLMRYHTCRGDKGQALKVYRNCLKVFEELFGESPAPPTRQLYQAIAADEPVDCQGEEQDKD